MHDYIVRFGPEYPPMQRGDTTQVITIPLGTADELVAELLIRDALKEFVLGPTLWKFAVPIPGQVGVTEKVAVVDTYADGWHTCVEVSSLQHPLQGREIAYLQALRRLAYLYVIIRLNSTGTALVITLTPGAAADRAATFQTLAGLMPPPEPPL